MSRETFYDREPAKYFQGEDVPMKPTKATHLVTYANFLSCDEDHSQDRPFTNCSPDRKKRTFKVNQFYSNQAAPYNDFKPGSKKISVKEGHHALSTINPLKFDPSDKGEPERSEIKRGYIRNKSSLAGATIQPLQAEPFRASKKVHSGKYTDSSSMKLSLSYVS